jgi:hypothetical protein
MAAFQSLHGELHVGDLAARIGSKRRRFKGGNPRDRSGEANEQKRELERERERQSELVFQEMRHTKQKYSFTIYLGLWPRERKLHMALMDCARDFNKINLFLNET